MKIVVNALAIAAFGGDLHPNDVCIKVSRV